MTSLLHTVVEERGVFAADWLSTRFSRVWNDAGRASERQLVERASECCPFILGASSAGERSGYHACDDGGITAAGVLG